VSRPHLLRLRPRPPDGLEVFKDASPFSVVLAVVALASTVTEFNSNAAACSMLLPVVAQLAVAIEVNPLALMVATTISTSFAFMLPIGTPPNAIVFATRNLTIPDMLKAGVVLNLMSCLLLSSYTALAFQGLYGEDPFALPPWAVPTTPADKASTPAPT